jgi:nucleoside-diphosphate-sugar epimerase
VVPRFVEQALANSPITVFGDGSQTRSFVYVDDVIDAISRIIQSNLPGEVLNIGGTKEVSMERLAKTIIGLTSSTSKIGNSPLPSSDPKRRCPDISRATSALGWAPKIPLEDGLSRFISWYRSTARTDSYS